MRWKALMPAIWGLVALVAILLAVVLWLSPAQSDLQDELSHARGEVPRFRSELPELVGASYAEDLQRAIDDGGNLRSTLEGTLRRHAGLLTRWFQTVEMVEGTPARDKFANAFRFHQDRVRELVTERAQKERRTLDELPLNTPVFVAKDQVPTLEEMKKAQREANLERLLLICAGDAGAFPYRAIEFQEGWNAVSGGPFQETSVTLRLSLPASKLHNTLRALCELKGEGPIVRIETLTTRPRPLPDKMEPEDVPLIDADILLVLSSFRL